MKPINIVKSKYVPLNRKNVDTDQIISKEFLKRIERTGFGQYLFYHWRFDQEGNPISDFILNKPEYANAEFILENDKYICGWAIEKMSKSMFNVVNPDTIVEKYGADTLRLYEMFLGPVEQSKPWDTNGIDGCHRFLRKYRD